MKLTRRKLIKKSGQIAGALALSLKGFNFFDWSAEAQEADIEKFQLYVIPVAASVVPGPM